MPSRALVLSGGGVAGISWLVGLATELTARGIDLATADRLIGTSAGSAVATQLATGQLAAAAAMQLSATSTEVAAQLDVEEFGRLLTGIAAEATSTQDAVRRLANLPRLDTSVSPATRRAAVAARLPVSTWPDRPLSICVVVQETGERLVLDASAGFDLVDVITASCAVPGVWPPVDLGGRLFVDGGTWSVTNADVAAGTDRTVIVVPTVLADPQADALRTEQERLRPGTTYVVRADEESVAAFGPNPLDPARRAPSYHAGVRQAAALAADLGTFWAD